MITSRIVGRRKKNCRHIETIVIRIANISSVNAGLEHVVCQACGHVSIRPFDDLSFHKVATTSSRPMRPPQTASV